MIPALIIWLIKKYYSCAKQKHTEKMLSILHYAKVLGLFIVCSLFSIRVMAQQTRSHYNVLYKGHHVGDMYLTQQQTGDMMNVKITSNVNVRSLMTVKVHATEESTYKEDKLLYSSVYREVNGKQKSNRQTKYDNNLYQLNAEGKISTLHKPVIIYNLIKLYCNEPSNITQVYSDNFQQFITIRKISTHQYRLELPDGNYNIYYYQNGKCNKVEVHNTFYTIQMQLAD